MSLFDVIRYPVNDIYNEDELALLPEDLYREWFIRCNGQMSNKDDSRVNRIKIAVTIQAINSTKANKFNTTNIGFEDLWKAVFTKMLKEAIKEYDPH
jgi:hypothetical protein